MIISLLSQSNLIYHYFHHFLLIILVAANVFVIIFISLFFAGNELKSGVALVELALLKSGILIYVKILTLLSN